MMRTHGGTQFGRTWSPMFERLAAKPLVSGARVPVNERAHRPTSVIAYLLWDGFDGGLLDGW